MSFTKTAIRVLCCFSDRMWLTSVVFPAPRKPERTVTGTLVVGLLEEDEVVLNFEHRCHTGVLDRDSMATLDMGSETHRAVRVVF